MRWLFGPGVAFVALAVSGCAEMTHLTRTRTLGEHQYILIDAKQRAISTRNGVSCAEPSPDALSAIAASHGLNLTTPQGTSVGQSLSIAEAAGSIGLRTQSIQLLRDHMYRVCESAQAGYISPPVMQLLHRRFQTTTVAILAIEQLTGTIRAPAVVLGGASDVGNAEAIVKLSATRETQAASVETAQKDLAARKTAVATAVGDVATKTADLATANSGGDAATIKAAQDALKTAQDKETAEREAEALADSVLTQRRATLAAIDRAITMAQATGSASATGTIETVTYHPGDVSAIASSVQKIVEGTFALTNTADFCMIVLAEEAKPGGQVNPASETYKACAKMLADGLLRLQ